MRVRSRTHLSEEVRVRMKVRVRLEDEGEGACGDEDAVGIEGEGACGDGVVGEVRFG